jgi:phage gp45-like
MAQAAGRAAAGKSRAEELAMHRTTPLGSAFFGYVAGGCRATVDQVDDSKLMQEMSGAFMKFEQRGAIESPQNYGFTSVVFKAEKDLRGKVLGCAETFISFMGGNRSFPVAGNMDDRRHRLMGLLEGDTAMFRGKGDKQQLHMTQDGGFWSAPQDKTVRMQLVPSDSDTNSTQPQQGASAAPSASSSRRDFLVVSSSDVALSGAGSGGVNSSGQAQPVKKGQQSVYKDGKDSYRFVDLIKDKTRVSGQNVHVMLQDGNTYVHVADDNKVYLGGAKGSGTFAPVMTSSGPSSNVLAKVG